MAPEGVGIRATRRLLLPPAPYRAPREGAGGRGGGGAFRCWSSLTKTVEHGYSMKANVGGQFVVC